MSMYPGLDIKAFNTHIDDHEWKEIFPGFRVKTLLSEKTWGKKSEYLFGYAELDPGVSIPPQKANLSCCTHLLEGEIWARLGRQRFQLEKSASNYFPAGLPHAYEASGDKGCRFVWCYATDNEIGEDLQITPASEEECRAYYQPNSPSNLMSPGTGGTGCRWATAGDTDPWVIVEAAQGMRSQRFQAHFDEIKGCKELWWGLCRTRPNTRYTPHYHRQSEIFYIVSGHGFMYGGSETFDVRPGSLLYLPPNCVHGMVAQGTEELFAIYVCNIETAGVEYNRIEIADVPIEAPDRDNWMLSKI